MSDDEIIHLPALEQERGLREVEIEVKGIIVELITLPNIEHARLELDPVTGKMVFEMTTRPPATPPPSPLWMGIAALFFTAVTIITLSLLMVGVLHAVDKTIFFNVWLAFCIAASLAFIGGNATATGKLPMPSFLGDNPITFTVVGGIASFVIVLILMVALNT